MVEGGSLLFATSAVKKVTLQRTVMLKVKYMCSINRVCLLFQTEEDNGVREEKKIGRQ